MRTCEASTLAAALALLAVASPLQAQQAEVGSELFSRGAWTARLDASADPKSLVIDERGRFLELATKAGAILWRKADSAVGAFVVRATIRVPRSTASGGVGLFFGGTDLEGMDRNYLACMVRPDGQYAIPHRYGVELHPFIPWRASPAVTSDSAGTGAINVVEWVVGPERILCRINGVSIYDFPRSGATARGALRAVEGGVGIRIDAGVHARLEGFEIVRGAGQ